MIEPTLIGRCVDCGRLYSAETGLPYCRECALARDEALKRVSDAVERDNLRTTEGIAERTGLSRNEVRRVLRELPVLARYVDQAEVCTECKRRAPIEGSHLCLQCHIDTLHELRTASDAAYDDAERLEDEPEPAMGARRLHSVHTS
ncbi:MAG TPA: hypothetical protein PKI11_20665, partial [Candidatus Hydrogenedentes bacterium]|nr:hypothetical protein [Candidatus Hydrogenedentota bacterium]